MCMSCNKNRGNAGQKIIGSPTRTVGSSTRTAGASPYGSPKVKVSFGNKSRGR